MKSPVLISVVISTYNRSKYIAECINSVLENSYRDFEIIVVDQSTNDEIKQIVESKFKDNPKVRYIYTEIVGLSHARNLGIERARGEIVAFIDDDALADKNWLQGLIKVYEQYEVNVAGGKIELKYEAPQKRWITQRMESVLGRLDWGDEIKEIKFPEWIGGGNYSLNKKVLASAQFEEVFGRKGDSLMSGEEAFFLRQLETMGQKCIYTPEAVVYHFVPESRMKRKWFFKRYYYQGKTTCLIDAKIHGTDYVRKKSREFLFLILSMVFFWRGKQNFVMPRLYHLALNLGYIKQALAVK